MLARKLESEHRAVRLCPDEWIQAILPANYSTDELDRLRDPVEAVQWTVTERLLSLDVDVILEWGFWVRNERENLRDRARGLGATVKLHYLDVPLSELLSRLERRNKQLPDGSFYVSPDDLVLWRRLFQAPDQTEIASYD